MQQLVQHLQFSKAAYADELAALQTEAAGLKQVSAYTPPYVYIGRRHGAECKCKGSYLVQFDCLSQFMLHGIST